MDKRSSHLTSVLVSGAAGAWTYLITLLRMLIAMEVKTYRPERYYMRGPGSKWREKHAHKRAHAQAEQGLYWRGAKRA
jgi:hypothetical protein